MKRRIALALAAASLATLGVFAPSPASAHDDVCAGTGTATLTTGIGAVVLHPSLTTKFTFTFTAGTCVTKDGLSATGYVTGNCGSSFGGGTTDSGHDFAFTSTGTALVLTGEVTGVVSAAVDVTRTGNSCLDKTARFFLITGAVTKTHLTACTTTTLTLTTNCNVV